MRNMHIAFIVESAHGHINPTLSITSRLVSYGYRVSYAVKEYFASRVISSGGHPIIYHPMEIKLKFLEEMRYDTGGAFAFDFERADKQKFIRLHNIEVENTISQLAHLYADDKPGLIIYDRCNIAGRALASRWNIPAIEHCPMMIDPAIVDEYDPTLVIVSLPEFFQTNRTALDRRFTFVGPIFTDKTLFAPWTPKLDTREALLISATTGLLPSVKFFATAIHAFENTGFHVVLSIGDELDPALLPRLPSTFEINRFSSQQSILEHSRIFIGHGGPSSIFEALRFGVPLVLVPPSQVHDEYARRVEELGLGLRVLNCEFSADTLRKHVTSLLENSSILSRVNEVKRAISRLNGAEAAASLIHQYITDGGRMG